MILDPCTYSDGIRQASFLKLAVAGSIRFHHQYRRCIALRLAVDLISQRPGFIGFHGGCGRLQQLYYLSKCYGLTCEMAEDVCVLYPLCPLSAV